MQVSLSFPPGLINAIFWMLGPDPADDLLKNHSPSINWFWFHFVKHVNGILQGYLLTKCKCQDILKMDHSCFVVVQRWRKVPESCHMHLQWFYIQLGKSICSGQKKALNWCCGIYVFEAYMQLYRLQQKKVKEVQPKEAKEQFPGLANHYMAYRYIYKFYVTNR